MGPETGPPIAGIYRLFTGCHKPPKMGTEGREKNETMSFEGSIGIFMGPYKP